jgi:hypothetical protein
MQQQAEVDSSTLDADGDDYEQYPQEVRCQPAAVSTSLFNMVLRSPLWFCSLVLPNVVQGDVITAAGVHTIRLFVHASGPMRTHAPMACLDTS